MPTLLLKLRSTSRWCRVSWNRRIGTLAWIKLYWFRISAEWMKRCIRNRLFDLPLSLLSYEQSSPDDPSAVTNAWAPRNVAPYDDCCAPPNTYQHRTCPNWSQIWSSQLNINCTWRTSVDLCSAKRMKLRRISKRQYDRFDAMVDDETYSNVRAQIAPQIHFFLVRIFGLLWLNEAVPHLFRQTIPYRAIAQIRWWIFGFDQMCSLQKMIGWCVDWGRQTGSVTCGVTCSSIFIHTCRMGRWSGFIIRDVSFWIEWIRGKSVFIYDLIYWKNLCCTLLVNLRSSLCLSIVAAMWRWLNVMMILRPIRWHSHILIHIIHWIILVEVFFVHQDVLLIIVICHWHE